MGRHLAALMLILASHGPALAECVAGDCHRETGEQIRSYPVQHGALREKGCTACHADHTAGETGVLKGPQDDICFSCHTEFGAFVRLSTFRHPLVREGKCTACHAPHGGSFTDLLPLAFRSCMDPRPWLPLLDLCLGCHGDKKPGSDGGAATGFRNGGYDLHEAHVDGKKGRKCQACHDSHASRQELHIREEVPFGTGGWKLPILFTKTATGGSCQVGCHREYGYDRVKPYVYGDSDGR